MGLDIACGGSREPLVFLHVSAGLALRRNSLGFGIRSKAAPLRALRTNTPWQHATFSRTRTSTIATEKPYR
jgi:hypothetical protein